MSTQSEQLRAVVRELELHAAAAGWDHPAGLFALVDSAALIAREPGLAAVIEDPTGLTSIEQEAIDAEHLEAFLETVAWPDEVAGAAAVLERLVLPPEAEADVPADPAQAAAYAAGHPDRQEVRIVAAALRTGGAWSAMRFRAYDEDDKVLTGPDLVPGLIALLQQTFEPGTEEPEAAL